MLNIHAKKNDTGILHFPQKRTVPEIQTPHARSVYPVTIDYDLSLEEMVIQANYDYVDKDIRSNNFRLRGKEKTQVIIELKHLNAYVSSDTAIQQLDSMGFRGVNIAEIIEFGRAYPEAQLAYPLIALGAVQKNNYGRKRVALLHNTAGKERDIRLLSFKNYWHENCRFPVVRKDQ